MGGWYVDGAAAPSLAIAIPPSRSSFSNHRSEAEKTSLRRGLHPPLTDFSWWSPSARRLMLFIPGSYYGRMDTEPGYETEGWRVPRALRSVGARGISSPPSRHRERVRPSMYHRAPLTKNRAKLLTISQVVGARRTRNVARLCHNPMTSKEHFGGVAGVTMSCDSSTNPHKTGRAGR